MADQWGDNALAACDKAHQLGGRTPCGVVVLADITQALALRQVGVERDDWQVMFRYQLIDFVFHQDTVQRHDRQAADVLLFDQFLDHRDLFDGVQRAGQPGKMTSVLKDRQLFRLAPAGIQHKTDEGGLHRVEHDADAGGVGCTGQGHACAVWGIAIFRSDFLDTGGQFRADIALVVQCTIHCTAGYAAEFGDLINRNCHLAHLDSV